MLSLDYLFSIDQFEKPANNIRTFAEMQKKKYPVDAILNNLKIDKLNEMQLASIEAIEKHTNVILLSRTGSGKTLVFLLPLIELHNDTNKKTQAMIIVPSRNWLCKLNRFLN